MSDDMPTLPEHTLAFFIGIFSSGKPCRASWITSGRQCRDADRCDHEGSYLFQEGIRKGLYPELEGTEVGRLVQALHLFGHECLVDWFALRVRRVHYGAKEGYMVFSGRHGRKKERQARQGRPAARTYSWNKANSKTQRRCARRRSGTPAAPRFRGLRCHPRLLGTYGSCAVARQSYALFRSRGPRH